MYKAGKTSLVTLVAFAIFTFAQLAVAEETRINRDELLMGVVPFMSPAALSRRLSPLVKYLGGELKQEVMIELSPDGATHIKRTDAGRYDMVLTAANHAIRAFDSGLYVPGVIPGNLTTAVIIVGSSSPINTMEQLKGKVIATPQKKGTLAIMAPTFFKEKGFKDDEIPKFVNYASQNAAFLAVKNGDVDAAFLAEFAIRKFLKKDASISIKEVVRTNPFPGISLILSSRLSEDEREKIVEAMLGLGESDNGKAVLKKISFHPFKRSSIEEFKVIRHYFNKTRR